MNCFSPVTRELKALIGWSWGGMHLGYDVGSCLRRDDWPPKMRTWQHRSLSEELEMETDVARLGL